MMCSTLCAPEHCCQPLPDVSRLIPAGSLGGLAWLLPWVASGECGMGVRGAGHIRVVIQEVQPLTAWPRLPRTVVLPEGEGDGRRGIQLHCECHGVRGTQPWGQKGG